MSLGSNELVLFTHNTGSLYPLRAAIIKRLLMRQLKGEYDRELAVKAWKNLANAGAKQYAKERRLEEPWSSAFTTADRDEAAKHWERWFRESAHKGEFDWMLPEGKRPRRNSGSAAPRKAAKKAKKRADPSRRRTRARLCPVGMQVQTLIFPKTIYSLRQARDWARRNGYTAAKFDETGDSYRLRQKDPSRFEPGMFRTISLGQVHAVVGCPKIGRTKKAAKKKATKKAAKKKATKKAAKRKTTKKAAKKKTTKKAAKTTASSKSLNERIKAHHMTTSPAGAGRKHVKRFGKVLFTGTAHEVSAWLNKQPKPKPKAKRKAKASAGWKKVRGAKAHISKDNRFVIEASEFGDFLLLDTMGTPNAASWRKLGRYGNLAAAKRAARDFR